MTELSAEARAILEAARHAEGPGPGDAARIHAAVMARVGGAAGGPQAGPGGPPGSGEAVGAAGQAASGASVGAAAGGGMAVKLLALVLVAGLVVAGGVWLAWPGSGVANRSAAEAVLAGGGMQETGALGEAAGTSHGGTGGTAPEAAGTAGPASAKPSAKRVAPREAAPRKPSAKRVAPREAAPRERTRVGQGRRADRPEDEAASSLGQELVLMERAKAGLDAGTPAAALAALNEHRARFATGLLAAEAAWLRIRTLCALDRSAEAGRQARRFLAIWPRSPYAPRIESTCAGAVSTPEADEPADASRE